MCSERSHSICHTATTYEVNTFKNKNHYETISVYSQMNAMSSLIIQSIQDQVENSHRCSITKTALKNFATFTGKYLRQSPFLIKNFKVTLLKTDPSTGVCFLMNIAEFLRSPVLKKVREQLLPFVNLKKKKFTGLIYSQIYKAYVMFQLLRNPTHGFTKILKVKICVF